MSKIYDNIECSLIGELPDMLRYAESADFCVGYFNLSEWDYISQGIDNLSGKCRLIIGMLPDGEACSDENPIEAITNRLIYGSASTNQRKLNELASQLHDRKLQIRFHTQKPLHAKLYLARRRREDDPIMCIIGSSNFTKGGLHSNYELNIDVVDSDITEKLANWFEERWNESDDISDNLIDIISRDIKDIQEAAIAYSDKLMDSDPKNIDAYYMRGKARLDSQQYEDAIKDFNKVIELDQKHAYAHCSRGRAYHSKGQYVKAIDDISKAIELAPKSAFAYYMRGKAHLDKQQYGDAIKDFSKIIDELDPEYAYAYCSRGRAYYSKRQYNKAIDDFNKAIKLAPNSTFVLSWLEKTKKVLGGNEGEVGEDSDKTRCGSSYKEYYKRGKNYLDSKKYDQSIENFNEALRLKPDDAYAHCSRGRAYHGKRQYDHAFRDFDKAIQLKPNDAFAHCSRGKAYYDYEQYDEAIMDFDRAIQLKPNDAFAHCSRGKAYQGNGQYDHAFRDFDKAIQLKSDDAFAYGSRGKAYYDYEQYDKAIEDLEKALKLKPNDEFATYWLRRSKEH